MIARAPFVTPAHAITMLALVDHALAIVPSEHALAYLRGFLVARSWESTPEEPPRSDPRAEPGAPVGRVDIVRRPSHPPP